MTRIYLSPPHMGPDERQLLIDAFDSNWIAPLGPHVDAFEAELAQRVGRTHVAALSSGTAALHLALILLGVQANDRVYCSTLTFAATANAVTYLHATPVFIDADPLTWNMDPQRLREALAHDAERGQLPKAVIVVDLYGICADYDAIEEACAPFAIPIIEDAAEALGATYKDKAAGSFGHFAAFSFNGNKIITTSGGGALAANSPELIQKARFLATQARDPAPHYQHSHIGYNYRLSNLLAAIGRGQLTQLNERVAARIAIYHRYREALQDLPGLDFSPNPGYGQANHWLTVITLDPQRAKTNPERLRLALEAQNIEARPVWKPMHLQPVFRNCDCFGGDCAQNLFECGLCLPSGSSLTPQQQEHVIHCIRHHAEGGAA